jgi:serine protease Do
MPSTTLKKSVIAVAVAAAITGAYSLGSEHALWPAHAAPPPAAALAAPGTSISTPISALPDMTTIVARNGPAVVNISVSGTAKNSALAPDMPQLDPDDPFYEFFRHFRAPQQRGGGAPLRGQASGFVLRDDGIILTNAHVVDSADEVTVKFIDKREFKAKVLGVDKASDVAVLKIDARNLPTLKIGSAVNARVGEWVLAIGSPFGFENSATAGIISAKSRSLPDDSYVSFIQTDVAVNPGNSGGPLFNMAGEVIGINSQIYSRSGGYQGVSFAIPIDVVMKVEEQIVKHGKVDRGRLGIAIQEVNPSLAESFGLKNTTGALVSSTENGSPAAKAGLEPGDVILGINGKEIGSASELPALVADMRPGETARLQVWRKGGTREINVTVGAQKGDKVASAEGKGATQGRLGLALRQLTPDERRQIDSKNGLLVEDVAGAAARAGIRPGDVLLSVNGEAVSSVEQLRALVAKAGKRVALLVQRDDAKLFVPVDIG